MNIVYSTLHVYNLNVSIFFYIIIIIPRHFLALLHTLVTCVDQDRSDIRCIPKYLNSETLSSEKPLKIIGS